jgi:hypothetical protein
MFNNREWASIIFGLAIFIWLLSRRDTRTALSDVVKALFQNKIIVILLAMGLYVGLVVWLFHRVGFWKSRLAKDTAFWFLGMVIIFVRDAPKATEDIRYLKKMLFENLKFVSALAFVVSLYTFSLWVEILSLPLLFILAGLSVVAGSKEEYLPVKQVVDFAMGIYGIILIIWAFINIVSDFQSFASLDNLRTFALLPLLSIVFMPFVYFLVLFMAYEHLFVLIDRRLKRDERLARFTKWRLLVLCHVNLRKLIRVTGDGRQDLMRVRDRDDVISLIREYGGRDTVNWQFIRRWYLRIVLALVFTALLVGFQRSYHLETGFGSYTTPQGEYHRAKTLWDWMELALVPVALALIAYGLNEANLRRETRRAEIQQQLENRRIQNHQEEEALQAYLDRMQELLLDKDLLKASEGSTVSLVAYTLTQVTLKRLSAERKAVVLGFLVTSQLVQQRDGKRRVLSLTGADLEGIGTPLGVAFLDLIGADLRGANLQDAMLDVPNLQNADLRMATLERSRLLKADLRGANLQTAVLAGSNLWEAICDEATILPNGKHWSGSDLTEFGAIREPPYSEAEMKEVRRELHLDEG